MDEDTIEAFISDAYDKIKAGEKFASFSLELTGEPRLLQYVAVSSLDKSLEDDDFSEIGLTDITGGPYNPDDYQHDKKSWTNELMHIIQTKIPDKITFYLRNDPNIISARILITIDDFYGRKSMGQMQIKKMCDDNLGTVVSEHLKLSELNDYMKDIVKTSPEFVVVIVKKDHAAKRYHTSIYTSLEDFRNYSIDAATEKQKIESDEK